MKKVSVLLAPLRGIVRLHKWALVSAVGLLLLYTLGGFLLVPYVAKRQLEAYVTDTLKRRVALGTLHFNPFSFAVEANDLRLSEADGSLMLGFQRLRVDAGVLCSIWRRAICLEEVRIDSPAVELVIARDGKLNLAALAPPSPEPEPPKSDADPPRVYVHHVELADGRVGFLDRSHRQPYQAQLGPFEVTLSNFQTEIGSKSDYSFAAITPLGEALRWSGQFTLQPFASTGRFALGQVKLATLDKYLPESLPFALNAGELDLSGRYYFELDPLVLDVKLPWLAIRHVAIAERAQRANAPIQLSSLWLRDAAFSYQKNDLGVRLVELSGLRVEAARNADGSFSLERLFAAKADPAPSGAARMQPAARSSVGAKPEREREAAAKPLRVYVDTFKLVEGKISAEDQAVLPHVKLEFAPIALTVRRWSNEPEARCELVSEIMINQRGRLHVRGDLALQPLDARGQLSLSHLELPFLQPYVAQSTAMILQSGSLNVQGDVRYGPATDTAHPLTFKGDVELASLHTIDDFNKQDFLRWANLGVRGIDLSLAPDRLSIDRVVVKKPYANVLIATDTSLNIQRVLEKDLAPRPPKEVREKLENEEEERKELEGEQAKLAEASAPPAPVAFPISIRRVEISEGSARFADHSVKPPFATSIVGLHGKVRGLSARPGVLAKVKLTGKVDRYAPVDITGTMNLLSATKYTDLSLSFRNIELTTFNPYSGKFAGYNISKGKLSTGLSYRVYDRKLDARHHVIVDNLEFGEKTDSKDAPSIPVRLALALLRDRHGVIDLELPVTGTLDDPKFRLRHLVWQVLRNVLTKAVTKPFAAIGKLAGGGDELAYVEFPSGSAELTPTENEKLTKLAKALVERPQLKLDVPMTLATQADSEAIARQKYAAQVRAPALQAQADSAAKERRLAALEASYQNLFKRAPAYPAQTKTSTGVNVDARLAFLEQALLEKLKPDKAALDAIANRRARAVQTALLSNAELSPDRVFITADRDDSKTDSGKVRMEMKLE
jgi:hypothetical protein